MYWARISGLSDLATKVALLADAQIIVHIYTLEETWELFPGEQGRWCVLGLVRLFCVCRALSGAVGGDAP